MAAGPGPGGEGTEKEDAPPQGTPMARLLPEADQLIVNEYRGGSRCDAEQRRGVWSSAQ